MPQGFHPEFKCRHLSHKKTEQPFFLRTPSLKNLILQQKHEISKKSQNSKKKMKNKYVFSEQKLNSAKPSI